MKAITKDTIFSVKSIAELHQIAGFDKPKHPLVTIIDYSKVQVVNVPDTARFICEFYVVNYKNHCGFTYGRQFFDHMEGTLHCTAPEQIITFEKSLEPKENTEGWGLYFHPELIRNTALGLKIKEYSFFRYDSNEALHLGEEEKNTLLGILKQMEREYHTNIDHYSQELIVSNIELFLNYCKRYYGRQFITRSNQNKDILTKFETFIADYFDSDKLKQTGPPTVKYCAEQMNLSTNYFSDLLKSETGKNAQEHIHYQLLEKAKKLLMGTHQTVNEIAYDLGFQYPQSFSKLFKNKVGVSPSIYRLQNNS